MAKAPSIDIDIEKARSANDDLQQRLLHLYGLLAHPAGKDQPVESGTRGAEQQDVDHLRKDCIKTETVLADLVFQLSHKVEAHYAAFEAINEVTRYERFLSFFSLRKASRHHVLRARRSTLAERLSAVLLSSDRICAIADSGKSLGLELQHKYEPVSAALMQQRNGLSAAVETARQELKEVNATLATVQWKAGNTADEARSALLLAERDTLSLRLEQAEAAYREVRLEHDTLDRSIELFETFAELINDRLFGMSLLLNKMMLEMERAIQLQNAVSGSLDPLTAPSDHPYLAELLTLHVNNIISLQEIERRKVRGDEGFLQRYAMEKNRVTGRADNL